MIGTSYKNLRQYCYFSYLSDGALEALARKLHIIKVPAGSVIIKEGAPADAFYLVSEGEVEIQKKTKWGQTARISIMGHGEGFGEMALLTCSSRCCSVIARTDVILFQLFKSDFEEIVRLDSTFSQMVQNKIQDYEHLNQMKTLQPFALLPPEKMAAVTSRLKEKTYAPGETIITQGEEGDLFYIIKSGKVSVMKKMLKDTMEHVATLEEGQGFGEEALITDATRNATVQAISETVVWTLSKPDFLEIMKSSFIEEVSPEEVLSKENGHSFIDVRMQMEYDEEYIPGAVNIPLDELRKRYAELDPSVEYYVYCLVGARSATATFLMNSQGFHAKSIKGGILNWPGPVVEGMEGIHNPLDPN